MNSGSSAFIGSAGQSSDAPSIRSWYQWSRPSCQAMSAPVRRTTTVLRILPAISMGGVGVDLERHRAAAAQALVGGDDIFRIAIVDPAGQRVGREAAEDDGMDRADARAGQHGDGGFRDHRQVEGDPVALLHAQALERVGELADVAVQFAIGDRLVFGRIVAFPDDRGLVAAARQVPVEAVVRDVEDAVLVPLDRNVRIAVVDIPDDRRLPEPVDPFGLFGPEAVRIADRALVHLQIALVVDMGPLRPFRRDGIFR